MAGVAAAAIIAAIALYSGEELRLARKLIAPLALAAFTNVFAWMGFTTLSMRWLSAGQGAMLVYTMPLWATLLAWPLLGKRPTLRTVAGLALCLGGISLLFGGQGFALGMDALPGVAFALSAAVLFAFGTVVLKPLVLGPLASLMWQLLFGCVPMVIFGLLFEHPRMDALSSAGWSLLLYMTLVPMGICYLTWFAALRRLPRATASVATILTPVIGVTTAAAILHEPFGLRQLLALALTISGIAVVLMKA
jgi:drug/metabolite transporter (DMT)-like permease